MTPSDVAAHHLIKSDTQPRAKEIETEKKKKGLSKTDLKGDAPKLSGDGIRKLCLIMRANLCGWPRDIHFRN